MGSLHTLDQLFQAVVRVACTVAYGYRTWNRWTDESATAFDLFLVFMIASSWY